MSQPGGWWTDFFSGLAVDLWRQAVSPEQTAEEADFLARHLGVEPPSRLLDVPCGDGRLALELAARGFELTGLDISSEFLAHARRDADARGLGVTWIRADMRDLPAAPPFDGAFCFGNSFGYLDDEGDAAFLRAVHAALRPAARFVVDLHMIAEVLFPQFEPEFDYDAGDIRMHLVNRYEPAEGRTYTDYTFRRGEVVEHRSNVHRLYTCRQVLDLLRSAGFAEPAIYGGADEEPFGIGSPKLLVVATRP